MSKLIAQQNHLCIYCLLPFGTVTAKKGGVIVMQMPVADHFMAYSSGGASSEENAVASCNLCNSIKSDLFFEDIESARRYILDKRNKSKYKLDFVPMTPVTIDPAQWAIERARDF